MGDRLSHVLPPDFWQGFAEKHWERAPGVFPQMFERALLTPDEAFRGLLTAFQRLQATDPGGRPRCYVEGGEIISGRIYALMAPRESDGTLEAYGKRLTEELNGKRFAVVVNYFNVHSVELWHRLRGFLRGLYAVVGQPASRTEPTFFFGNYVVTPFGIHTDEAGVFTFTVAESKTMLVWPERYFADRGIPAMSTHILAAHEPFSADATHQTVGRHDFMYWPSSHWHIGESSGEMLTSLGVGVYFDSPRDTPVASGLRLALHARRGKPLKPFRNAPTDGSLPPELEAPLAEAIAAVQAGALRREVQAEWMRRLTSDGCLPAPPLEPCPLDLKDRVRLADGGPVLHAVLPDGLLIAANGHSFFLGPTDDRPFDPSHAQPLVELIAELNRGETIRVGPAARKSGGMGQQVFATLEAIAASRAIRKV